MVFSNVLILNTHGFKRYATQTSWTLSHDLELHLIISRSHFLSPVWIFYLYWLCYLIKGIVAVNESPHEKMHLYIEAAWGFSTVFGILLFMAEIAIICWVVFIKVSIKAALAGK